ncbi:conserved repeat domain-containing protein [Clostridium cavendishii DSM 21758]|uniref:Conserved repeat domain-containing protein n=1 Tax=Clostridium cavendishii DSM 21758 TaxID=1121302 RepID=A0A1M6J2C9_9CLOT|nr:hypothetical protein [Clostridium cavendishii]SHJ40751.1 conserved repeat domain-containing protein [Clostridium cavendishii DSM 21758]
MGSEILSLTLNKTNNILIMVGGTSSFTLSVRNLSSSIRLYNLNIYLSLPDGLTLSSSTLPVTSTISNTDGTSLNSWINLKDLAPLEAPYVFDITLKCASTFKNGTSIPFGYVFSGIIVKCEVDTKPRGNYDTGNEKYLQQANMTFKSCRYYSTISTSGKVLKGAGTAPNLTDYTKVYTSTCKFFNNSLSTSTVNITILLEDGIRYLGIFSTSGTDSSSFSSPIISTVTINGKNYIQLYYGSVLLSKNSNTTLVFNYAVWNKYNNNQGNLIYHGTKLNMLMNMSSIDDSYDTSIYFYAMDLIITTTVNKTSVDVQSLVNFSYTYSVGQYFDIQNIVVNYFIPDGILYTSSSVTPTSVVDDPTLKGYYLTYNRPIAIKNSTTTITIYTKIDSYYRYKNIAPDPKLPVVSFDDFIAIASISGITIELQLNVSDSATTSCSITLPSIKKEFLNGYYRNGTVKTISTLAPGDLAEYRLTYDASTLKAIQKQIYLDDFFPLSADPIDNLTYNITGYLPTSTTPLPIDPHGQDFYYGDIPGSSSSVIVFKVPIKLLGSSGQNMNLLKIKGINTYNVAYSNRTQVLINIGTPNLQLTKSVSGPNKTTIKSSEIYSYTVKITNTNTLGTETDAFSFELNDTLSSWFTIMPNTIQVTGTGLYGSVTYDSTNIKLPINKLAPGQSLTLFYSVTLSDYIPPNLTITTTATNTNPYSQLYDAALDNFRYSNLNKTASVSINSASISLAKTTNNTLLKVGSDISYTITLTIPQGTIVYGVYIKDTLPSGNQSYEGSAFRNNLPITPSVSNNIITFPNEGTIDARLSSQTIIYTLNCKITNATKTVNTLTSTQTNTCQVFYKQTATGTSYSISKNLIITINHPNIVLALTATDTTTSTIYTQTAVINTNSIMLFKLDFLNNSYIKLINGTVEIPINDNFIFTSINVTTSCSANYDSINKKIVISIPSLDVNMTGYLTFILTPKPNLNSGSSMQVQATATKYYNDVSTKIYGGETSNIITCSLPPGVSLLPNPIDKVNDSTSFRITQPGSVATIINYFQNTGGGYDSYNLKIDPVGIDYTLYIDDIKIADVSKNTLYQADLDIMKNLAPNDTRVIKIESLIPITTPLGFRFDFIVTTKSKTSPYPKKTVLNIDPH